MKEARRLEYLPEGQSTEDVKETELTRYKSMAPLLVTGNPISWWRDNAHSFPSLSQIARKYLAAPASSVPSERMFSSAGNFASKQRARLDPDALEREVLLHHFFE